jgi:hypothetical protein
MNVVGDITASNARFSNIITAQTLVVQVVSSSTEYASGSNIFGNSASNTHQFTGSVLVSGSIGIGIANPAFPLEVSSTSTTLLARFTSNQSNAAIRIVNSSGGFGRTYSIGSGDTGSAAGNNFYIYDETGGAARFVISGSGNVGIGTISPASILDVRAGAGTAGSILNLSNITGAAAGNIVPIRFYSGNTFGGLEQVAAIYGINPNAATNNGGALVFATSANGTATTPAERMRITSEGALNFNGASVYTGAGCINSTVSSTSDFVFSGLNTNATNPRGIYIRNANSTAGDYAYYLEASGATKFYVTGNGVIYSTNSSVQAISDARHKENIRDLDKGLSEILLLKPRLFDWKEGKGTGNKNVMGFIAQEVETIFPELISSWKETIDATESFKTIAMSNIIPYLVKAIQELKLENDTLKAILQRNNIQ